MNDKKNMSETREKMADRDKTKICSRCNMPYIGRPAVSRHGLGDICPQCGKEEAFLAAGFKNAVEMALQVQRLEDETREKPYNGGN